MGALIGEDDEGGEATWDQTEGTLSLRVPSASSLSRHGRSFQRPRRETWRIGLETEHPWAWERWSPVRGSYPSVDEEEPDHELLDLESQVNTKNYRSVYENEDAAEGELQRLIERGFAMILSVDEAKEKFEKGTSRLALISEQKDSGVIKHRLIIDLLRSGGNSRAKVPERIILPRVIDVVKGIQELWKRAGGQEQGPEFQLELFGADLRDAYCHLGVAESELKHCIAPSVRFDRLVLFKAMLFCFKGAPLIMGRLAGAMTRQWGSAMEGKASPQTYMDDPLMVVAGDQKTRDSLVARMLYLAKVFGINLAYEKGERGTRVVWIGVTIEVDQDNGQIIISVPQKLVDEVLAKMQSWAGMTSVREFRAVTGKLSWIAGTLPRSWWAVSSFYAALADVVQEAKDDKEAERAEKRQGDQRPHRSEASGTCAQVAHSLLAAGRGLEVQKNPFGRPDASVGRHDWCVPVWGGRNTFSGGQRHGRAHSHIGVSSDSKRRGVIGNPVQGGCGPSSLGSLDGPPGHQVLEGDLERRAPPFQRGFNSGPGSGKETVVREPLPELGGSRDGHRHGPAADAGNSGTSPAMQASCTWRRTTCRAQAGRKFHRDNWWIWASRSWMRPGDPPFAGRRAELVGAKSHCKTQCLTASDSWKASRSVGNRVRVGGTFFERVQWVELVHVSCVTAAFWAPQVKQHGADSPLWGPGRPALMGAAGSGRHAAQQRVLDPMLLQMGTWNRGAVGDQMEDFKQGALERVLDQGQRLPNRHPLGVFMQPRRRRQAEQGPNIGRTQATPKRRSTTRGTRVSKQVGHTSGNGQKGTASGSRSGKARGLLAQGRGGGGRARALEMGRKQGSILDLVGRKVNMATPQVRQLRGNRQEIQRMVLRRIILGLTHMQAKRGAQAGQNSGRASECATLSTWNSGRCRGSTQGSADEARSAIPCRTSFTACGGRVRGRGMVEEGFRPVSEKFGPWKRSDETGQRSQGRDGGGGQDEEVV